MATYASLFKALIVFLSRIVPKRHRSYLFPRKQSNTSLSTQKFQRHTSFIQRSKEETSTDDRTCSTETVIFNVEEALLKSISLFPYFMLVCFEAGGPVRSLILLLAYPLISLLGKDMGLKVMVFISFFGIKADNFIVGRAVLPKFFLEDVGLEGFEVLDKFEKKIGVSRLPRVMIESSLKDYLKIDYVVGRELKVVHGYFTGLMLQENTHFEDMAMRRTVKEYTCSSTDHIIGVCGSKNSLDHPLFFGCKEIYIASEQERSNWLTLPKERYTRPLIFHDGRLATIPTPTATLAILMWAPLGFVLGLLRAVTALSLPTPLATPILAFLGMHLLFSSPHDPPRINNNNPKKVKPQNQGTLYVCNHKTLLDPLYLSVALNKPLTAVTYSLSRMSEILAPIKTVRLTRDRGDDGRMMKELLDQGDLVVCPEGTTCREPYLLRFSPLFAEMSDRIVPVAMDSFVTMFYGTTASGLKCLDPLFFLMNPQPSYTVRLLDVVHGGVGGQRDDEYCELSATTSRFDVANHVQAQIGTALGFQCTRLTRKDKYLVLAGNDGVCKRPGPN